MDVHVSGDTGSGGTSDVHADINAVWVERLPENADRSSGLDHHFAVDILLQLLDISDVLVRHDHKVAGRVRIPIHDYKGVLTAMQDQVVFISFFFQNSAEETTLLFMSFWSQKILFSPRCIYILGHVSILEHTTQNATQFLNASIW